MAYVVVFAEGAAPQRFPLNGLTVVGRALGCQIWLDDKQLSRKHCKIESVNGTWVLTDLSSRNGTFLQRAQVRKCVLNDGDAIYVGGARIHFHADPQVTSHRPSDPTEAMRAPEIMRAEQESSEETQVPVAPAPRRLAKTPVTYRESGAPTPQPLVAATRTSHKPSVPLPFARPPAQPIIDGEEPKSDNTSGAGGMSSSWFSAVVNRLRSGLK